MPQKNIYLSLILHFQHGFSVHSALYIYSRSQNNGTTMLYLVAISSGTHFHFDSCSREREKLKDHAWSFRSSNSVEIHCALTRTNYLAPLNCKWSWEVGLLWAQEDRRLSMSKTKRMKLFALGSCSLYLSSWHLLLSKVPWFEWWSVVTLSNINSIFLPILLCHFVRETFPPHLIESRLPLSLYHITLFYLHHITYHYLFVCSFVCLLSVDLHWNVSPMRTGVFSVLLNAIFPVVFGSINVYWVRKRICQFSSL